MRMIANIIITICIMMAGISGSAEPTDKSPVINLMIDADIPPAASDEQAKEASELLLAIYKKLEERGIGATVFSTQDLISTYARLRITYIGRDPKFELAISGNSSGEKLSKRSYSDQKAILKRSKEYIESCRVCGENDITVRGFMPQSFDQNADTYRVLDEMGIAYDAGFIAGVIYAPGHEEDVWPYQIEGHKVCAVPVSSYNLSGQKVPLQDIYFKDNGLASAQWHDALIEKFNEAKEKNEPVVVILTKSVSGTGGYLDALERFLDHATSNDATFVTTTDLVNMSLDEGHVPQTDFVKCTTCSQKSEDSGPISISIAQNSTKGEAND